MICLMILYDIMLIRRWYFRDVLYRQFHNYWAHYIQPRSVE